MARTPITLLVNPWARHAGRGAWTAPVLDALQSRFAVDVQRPASGDEMESAARDAVRGGAGAVVVAGGDGTINRVAQAVAGSGVPLGIIPLGTANDLARQHGIPLDARGAAATVAAFRPCAVDVLRVNGRRFCTVGGLGIVARSALLVNRCRARAGALRTATLALGTGAYRLSAAAHVLGLPSPATDMTLCGIGADDDAFDDRCAAHGMFVTNQSSLGGGIALPGGARPDDGVFELLTVHPASRLRLLDTLGRLMYARPVDPGVLPVRTVRAASIECTREQVFFGDGDALATGTSFRLEIEPRALTLLH